MSQVVSKRLSEFDGSETLVGEHGNKAVITGEVYRSNVHEGMWAVETEFGTLYLDDDLEHLVEV